MASFTQRILNDDFMWDAVTSTLHTRKRRSGTGFIRFDCPLCTQRGESADKKARGGVKRNADGLGVFCFNCGFRSKYVHGSLLSNSFKSFLLAIGSTSEDVERLNHKAFTYRSLLQKSPEAMAQLPEVFTPEWKSTSLPEGAKPLTAWAASGCEDPDFIDVVTYLYTERGTALAEAWDYAWSPAKAHEMNRRLIIPFRHEGRVVGYSARIVDPNHPQRYHMIAPDNFLFNVAALSAPNRKFGILVEGGLDAIGLDGTGLMGARLNPQQTAWIKSFGKEIIVLPDRDARGQDLIDVALSNKWAVAFPSLRDGSVGQRWWEADVKDAAEAVKRYGRPWTLTSVIRSATTNSLEIGVKRKWLY